MRTVLNTTLDGTAYILTDTQTVDDIGGYSDSWGTAGTVACHLSPRNVQESETVGAGRILSEASRVLTCAGTVSLSPTQRVKVDSVEYEVLAVSTPRTWQLALRADVKEVD